jgi:glutathione S-transferase
MLQLYFFPMACSLASRMALMEAGIEARYHLVHI